MLSGQQTISIDFHSDTLNENRTIRIHLPKSYNEDNVTKYPLLLSFDGEYLFYSLMGSSEVLTIREMIPETIVVGIDQNKKEKDGYPQRWLDCDYDYQTGKLKGKGIRFLSFIKDELIPFLNKNYKIGSFYSIAGHSLTANYINYFLDDSRFKGFIAVSPYIPDASEKYIQNTLDSLQWNIYYFLCTGTGDLTMHQMQIRKQDSTLFNQINNAFFNYSFKNYENENHMSLVTRSSADALTQIFSGYVPIYTLDIDSELVKNPDLIAYLTDRYNKIKATYGIDVPMREDDLTSIGWLIEEQQNWDDLKKIADWTIKEYPNSIYGYYMLGTAQEKMNDLKAALKSYKTGYNKLGDDISNKEQFYEDIERVEKLIKEK